MHSLCYTSKYPFQTSEWYNLFITEWLCVFCRSRWGSHLPFLTCTSQHLFVSSGASQRCEIFSLQVSDVSPLSIHLFFLPLEAEFSGCNSQNLFSTLVNPPYCVILRCCFVLTSTEWGWFGFGRQWYQAKIPGLQSV